MSPRKLEVQILGDESGAQRAFNATSAGAQRMGSSITSAIGGAAKFTATAFVGIGVAAATTFGKGFVDALDRQELAGKVGDDVLAASATVYRNAWGDTLEEVALLAADTERAFGSGENLAALTESAFILAQKFDTDVSSAMQTASELAQSFGLEGQKAFDLLAVGMAGSTAEVRDEMSAAIREYGTFFNDMGMSAESMIGLFSDFGEGGAMDLDKVGDAFKEFTIRATDGSKATAQAFSEMGLEAGAFSEALMSGDGADSFKTIIDGLLAIKDPAAQAAASIALFGTPLEDLSVNGIPETLKAFSDMSNSMGDVSGATADLGNELGGNLRAKFESFKRQGLDRLAEAVQDHVLPAVERMEVWFRANWPQIRGHVVSAIDGMQPAFDQLRTWFGNVVDYVRANWPEISAVLDSVKVFITDTVAPAIATAVEAVGRALGSVVSWVIDNWPQISSTLGAVKDFIVDEVFPALVTGAEALKAGFLAVVDAIKAAWDKWGDDIQAVATATWDAVSKTFAVALSGILAAWEVVRLIFEGSWNEAMTRIAESFYNTWMGMVPSFKAAWAKFKAAFVFAVKALVVVAVAQIQSIVTGFVELPGKIKDAFYAAAPVFRDVGVAMMKWIVEGIVSSVTEVGTALWNSLPQAVRWGLENGPMALDLFGGLSGNPVSLGVFTGVQALGHGYGFEGDSGGSFGEPQQVGTWGASGPVVINVTDVSGQATQHAINEAKRAGVGGPG